MLHPRYSGSKTNWHNLQYISKPQTARPPERPLFKEHLPFLQRATEQTKISFQLQQGN